MSWNMTFPSFTTATFNTFGLLGANGICGAGVGLHISLKIFRKYIVFEGYLCIFSMMASLAEGSNSPTSAISFAVNVLVSRGARD